MSKRRHFLPFLTLALAAAGHAFQLAPMPPCPGPDVPAGIIVNVDDHPIYGQPHISRAGNTFKVVFDRNIKGSFLYGAGQSLVVYFGKLPIGEYVVNVYGRVFDDSPTPREALAGSLPLSVSVAAPGTAPCGPATISVQKGGFQSAATSNFFPEPIEVLVKDAQNRPVPNVQLYVDLREATSALPTPGVLVTDESGVAKLTASATSTAGLAQVGIGFTANALLWPPYRIRTYAVLRTYHAGTMPAEGVVPVVTYFSEQRNHFFLTANPEEMSILDAKPQDEWVRGGVFLGYPSGTTTPAGLNPVCRYLGLPSAGLDSHFFSAFIDECEAVGAKFGTMWELETNDAFREYLPDLVTGACPAGTSPVYRLFNNKPDANHLYTSLKSARDALVSAGYISEGYGPDGVGWCAPQ